MVFFSKSEVALYYVREMYKVRDGFFFSDISFDRINILSSHKANIKANVLAQLLFQDGIMISYTEKKL